GRDAVDGLWLVVDIKGRKVSFSGGVELQHLWDTEPVPEVVPYIGSQSIAAAQPYAMFDVMRVEVGVQEVTAQFADILEQRAVPARDVVPESACRELVPDHDRTTTDQHGAGRHDATHAVVHRQTVVHSVARAGAHHAGKPVGPLH